jgi:NitT/TauT family transport system permease protein
MIESRSAAVGGGGPRSRARAGIAGSGTRARAGAAATLMPIVGILAALALWWLSVIVFDINPLLLPAPPEVLAAFNELRPYLLEQTGVTLTETLLGFGLAVPIGLLIGILIASSRTIERMFYPSLVALNAVPKLAFAPLLIVWLGFGQLPKVLMAVLLCVFPIVIASATGLMSMPAEFGELARSLGSSWRRTFVKIRFPNALPEMFLGLKVAMPLALVGAVIGEFAGGDSGLGFIIVQASGLGNTPLAFAAVVLLALMGIALFYALVGIERRLLPWVRETTA